MDFRPLFPHPACKRPLFIAYRVHVYGRGFKRAVTSAKWMLGMQASDKINVSTFGEELSLLERMLLKSLREGGGLAHLKANAAGLGLMPAAEGSLAMGQPLPFLLETLREDGTLAAVALMDGRPVAMAPYWIRVR